MTDRIRVGIVHEGPVFHRWQVGSIRQLLSVEGVVPAVVVRVPEHTGTEVAPSWRQALYRWYSGSQVHPSALEPEDPGALLGGVPTIRSDPFQPGSDAGAMAQHGVDLLVYFGPRTPRGKILSMPRFGVWAYHHGDVEHPTGGPVGFWEILNGEPVIGAALLRFANDGTHTLRKGAFRLHERTLSAAMDRVMAGASGWMAQACRAILAGNADAAEGTPIAAQLPEPRLPGNLDVLRFMLAADRAGSWKDAHTQRSTDEWNFGVLYQPIASLLEARPSLNVRWLPSPSPGQMRRSPFGYLVDGQLNVLYAKYDTSTGRSEISRLRPKRDNILKRSRTMLTSATRAAYPFVVQHEGRHLVVLETGDDRVDLYRINEENEALELVGTLLHQALRSPTVFQHQGRWWMMGTMAPWEDEALNIFYAPALEGPWTPHLLNPVKMDVHSARPAGTPFIHEGLLYRPAADSSDPSGWRISLMQVQDLTPTTFHEVLVRTIGPIKGSPWSHGTGTLSQVGDLTLVDGRRPMPKSGGAKRGSRSRKTDTSTSRKSAQERAQDDDDED